MIQHPQLNNALDKHTLNDVQDAHFEWRPYCNRQNLCIERALVLNFWYVFDAFKKIECEKEERGGKSRIFFFKLQKKRHALYVYEKDTEKGDFIYLFGKVGKSVKGVHNNAIIVKRRNFVIVTLPAGGKSDL